MWFGVIVCVAVLAAVGLAAIPVARYGPNDLRYPDYIVFPKLNCNKEGYFPHPRNCSWFYRCNDRIGRGFFWSTIYECEPGTVFSDDLDQCIFPHDPKYPCKPTNGTVCDTVKSSCKNYETCSYDGSTVQSSWLCQSQQCTINGVSQPVSNICQNGKLFSSSLNRCVQKPQSGNPCPPKCDILEDLCKNYDVCKPFRRNVRLCSLESCHQGAESYNKNLCKDQQLYDIKTRTCVNEPADSALCKNQEDCKLSSCEKYELCKPLERNVTLCKSERCTIGGVDQPEKNMCVGALLYDILNKTCVAKPADSALCENQKDCNIVESSCDPFKLCKPEKRNVTLCKSEICTIGGEAQNVTDKCSKSSQLYDIQNKACVDKPYDSDLCVIECNIVTSTCKDFELCKPEERNVTLCKSERCTIGGVKQNVTDKCSKSSQLYDIQNKTCVNIPTNENLCTVVVVGEDHKFTCPRNLPWILDSDCRRYSMCNSTTREYISNPNLCCAYYECDQIGNTWEGVKKFCPPYSIFSDKDKACIPKPNNAELCKDQVQPSCEKTSIVLN